MKAERTPKGRRELHVLVVDDDVRTLEETGSRLKSEGHRVTAFSRASGVRTLLRELRPDVVVIDVLMPDLSGRQLARILSECEREHAPVVILHSRLSERVLRTVTDIAGAAGIIKKTDSALEFLLAFNAILERVQGGVVSRRSLNRTFSGTHRVANAEAEAEAEAEAARLVVRTGNTRG